MSCPLDAINGALDRLARHRFYAGRIPTSVADAAEFAARVPVMRRADFVAEMAKPGFGAFGGAPAIRMNFSPMGTGLVPILQTRSDMAAMIAACRTHLAACAIRPGDVCAVFFGYHLFVAGLYYQSQMEAHGVACLPLGPGEAERGATLCNDTGVTVLAGNPSFALRLVAAGLRPPRVFFAGGEPFTGNPALYGAARAAMPETLLIDAYSLSEFIPVGRTFPGGEGVHLFDELLYAEVIDPESGQPVADGMRGELVLTHLAKETQPLLRYRTGDLTVKATTAPLFGRTVSLPRVVFGRTDEMVKAKGVKLYPSELSAVLRGIAGLDGKYRLAIARKPGGGDEIRLVLQGTATGDALAEVAARFQRQTLIAADAIEVVPSLPEGPTVEDRR